MALKPFKIAHLYPSEMNIYGDRGNIMVLTKRLAWRGIKAVVDEVEPGTVYDFTTADIVFGGGGQDRGQNVVAEDLKSRQINLLEAANAGVVMLTICGTYQLFGYGFTTKDGDLIPGIGLFKTHTMGSDVRMIGNIVIKTPYGELVGFENHSGQTTLDEGQEALGQVVKGFGNNSSEKHEGAVYNNCFGTYLHGPILPKNPQFADELIHRALVQRGEAGDLIPLRDELEHEAARVAKTRSQ